jgi:hypothetical protein
MATFQSSDFSFEEYNQRQLSEISPERVAEKALQAKAAGKFNWNGTDWIPNDYKGYAIITQLNDLSINLPLIERLTVLQKSMAEKLQPNHAFYHLSVESFHQTVANTLSADRFEKNIAAAGLENQYPQIVEQAFNAIHLPDFSEPVKMKMVGLSIFGTAIGLLGIFENQNDYERITNFRKDFYLNDSLAQLDVKMTRPFIGHITLTYIEHPLSEEEKHQLANTILALNEQLTKEENYFYLSNTTLRQYNNLGTFYTQNNYPSIQL